MFFLKNTANSVLGQNSWRSSYSDRRLANLTGLALNERTFASQSEVKLLYISIKVALVKHDE